LSNWVSNNISELLIILLGESGIIKELFCDIELYEGNVVTGVSTYDTIKGVVVDVLIILKDVKYQF